MILDCFIFNNELDLLEVRVHTLAPWVDGFILCEANRTFDGREKPYVFQESKTDPRFNCGKPVYSVQVDLSSLDSTTRSARWKRESIQRWYINQAFDTTVGRPKYGRRWDLVHGLSPSDRIILSDLNEIPDLHVFDQVAPDCPTVISWHQPYYYYWVNMKCWQLVGSVSCTLEIFSGYFGSDMESLRNARFGADMTIEGGWIFGSLGRRESFSSIFGRNLKRADDTLLPAYLVRNKERFKNWWYRHDASSVA
jgi:beta-1,4-mannosyl-glycoprotein beta-1,4-N-acetylglucosaminyltransferase